MRYHCCSCQSSVGVFVEGGGASTGGGWWCNQWTGGYGVFCLPEEFLPFSPLFPFSPLSSSHLYSFSSPSVCPHSSPLFLLLFLLFLFSFFLVIRSIPSQFRIIMSIQLAAAIPRSTGRWVCSLTATRQRLFHSAATSRAQAQLQGKQDYSQYGKVTKESGPRFNRDPSDCRVGKQFNSRCLFFHSSLLFECLIRRPLTRS